MIIWPPDKKLVNGKVSPPGSGGERFSNWFVSAARMCIWGVLLLGGTSGHKAVACNASPVDGACGTGGREEPAKEELRLGGGEAPAADEEAAGLGKAQGKTVLPL